MQKKFGQNFLTSPDAREKIVALLELTPGDRVWEVGPGLGAMTSSLLSGGANVTAFELDRGFISLLTGFLFTGFLFAFGILDLFFFFLFELL